MAEGTKVAGLKLPLEEYFRYHPPTTQERIDKHDAVNAAALKLAKALVVEGEGEKVWGPIHLARNEFMAIAKRACTGNAYLSWTDNYISEALDARSQHYKATTVLMSIHVARMIVNQSIAMEDAFHKQGEL